MKKIIFNLFLGVLFLGSTGCDQMPPAGGGTGTTEVLWSFPKTTNTQESVQPVIENGKTYIAHDTNITCAELATGKILWSTGLGNIAKGLTTPRSIASRKLLHDGNLLFQNHGEWVKAFDKANGRLVWNSTITNFNGRDLTVMAQNSTHLFLGGNGQVIRLSKSNGAVDMRIQLDQLAQAGTLQRTATLTVSPDGNYLYVPTSYENSEAYGRQGNVFCYNAHTGNMVWGHHFTPKYIMRENMKDSVLVETGLNAVGITQNSVVAPLGMAIAGLDRATGKQIWVRDINDDGFVGAIATDGNTVYIGSTGGSKLPRIYALDASTGATKWITATTGNSLVLELIEVRNNKIVFCDGSSIYILDQQSGSIIWQGKPPEYQQGDREAVYLSSAAYNESYIVNVGSKKIYCLRAP